MIRTIDRRCGKFYFCCWADRSSDGMLIDALGKLNVSIVVSKMLYNVKDTRVNEMRKWNFYDLRVFVIKCVQGFRVLSAKMSSNSSYSTRSRLTFP